MNNIGYAVLIVFLSLCQGAWAKDPYVDINATMCEEGETVYISCAFDGDVDQYSYVGPVASVCAKLNTSPNGGYVQYRYGIPSYDSSKGRLELQYPEKNMCLVVCLKFTDLIIPKVLEQLCDLQMVTICTLSKNSICLDIESWSESRGLRFLIKAARYREKTIWSIKHFKE
ncbi:hypothetical protein GVN18_42445 [Pseudomonas sp. ODNR1LW]|nr:hypothetical protein [Pseudomonas sp. ODNR1LW]